MSYKVFVVAGPRDKKMGGIGDYAYNLASELGKLGVSAVNLTSTEFGAPWENDNFHETLSTDAVEYHDEYVARFLADHTEEGVTPVLHLQMCVPYCGFVVSPDFCKKIPTVITVHEFSRISPEGRTLTKEFARASLQLAFSKKAEYEALVASFEDEPDVAAAISAKSSFQDIPSNFVLPESADQTFAPAENWDIAHFGMIRPGKDIDKILRVAEMIKEQGLPSKVKIIGSTLWQASSPKDMSDLLVDMIGSTFGPEHLNGIDAANPKLLGDKLVELNQLVPLEDRLIPVEYYLDMPDAEVLRVLSESKLAYMPFSDGASEHSGSLPPVVGWCHGVISKHSTEITPDYFGNIMYFADTPEEVIEHLKAAIADPADLNAKHASPERREYIENRRFSSVAQQNVALYSKLEL